VSGVLLPVFPSPSSKALLKPFLVVLSNVFKPVHLALGLIFGDRRKGPNAATMPEQILVRPGIHQLIDERPGEPLGPSRPRRALRARLVICYSLSSSSSSAPALSPFSSHLEVEMLTSTISSSSWILPINPCLREGDTRARSVSLRVKMVSSS